MSLTAYAVGIVLIIVLVAVVHFRAKKKPHTKPVGPTDACQYVWTPWNSVDSVAALQAKALGAAEGKIPLIVRDQSQDPYVAYIGGYSADMKKFTNSQLPQNQLIKPGQTWYLTSTGTCPKALASGTALGPHLMMALPSATAKPWAVGYLYPNGGMFGEAGVAGYGYVRTGRS